MSEVRVRFAPSPTGSFHIGSARTALFNWLYARHTGGKFVLRIEDTDRERNTPEALEVLLAGMRWLGLDWDEGPEVGGSRGPYFQSERGKFYERAVAQLMEQDRAYEKEGAIFFRLEGERYREFDKYLDAEVEKVRSEAITFEDLVRGSVQRVEERDFPIVRSNGEPVFHLVNVVDDLEMGITHVIRGEDHLTNTTKHIHLFHALGTVPPVYAHLPLILKDPAMGKGKMSKRDRGALVETYVERDFSPEAVVNFISLLGWSPKEDREYMPIGEIIERFDLKGVQKGAARFDEKKMAALNTRWIHEMPFERYLDLAKVALKRAGCEVEKVDPGVLEAVLKVAQAKTRSMEGLPEMLSFLFQENEMGDPKARVRLESMENPVQRATELKAGLEALPEWSVGEIDGYLARDAEARGGTVFEVFPLLRYAVTGKGGGPDLVPLLAGLGSDYVLRKLESFRMEH
ncbi:MAG: glutamate--tRNA ligase [Puniceicoccaceae bacterium]